MREFLWGELLVPALTGRRGGQWCEGRAPHHGNAWVYVDKGVGGQKLLLDNLTPRKLSVQGERDFFGWNSKQSSG